jgi:type IV pilus assembly protein PilE
MITVVIISILASIAIPAYNAQIRKSRRTEAKTALLDLAGREEKYFNTNPTVGYTTSSANLGYAATTLTTMTNYPVGSGYYTVTVDLTLGPPYTITATAVGDQAKDVCSNISVDSFGKQAATGSTTASVDCWK